MNRDELWLLKEKYAGEENAAFASDCDRLKHGEPLAYLIGHIPFLNTTIYLDSHPLIPRTETEYWVAKAIEHMQTNGNRKLRILDLCAGSGCIGVAVAKALPEATIHFAEIDVRHHATIVKNIELNSIDLSQVQVFGGNLFEDTEPSYDFILTNPPYLPEGSPHVEESVREHEPQIALYGGIDGLELIEKIIRDAQAYLIRTGFLYMEHEPNQTEAIAHIARQCGFQTDTHSDQFGVSRYTILSMAQ